MTSCVAYGCTNRYSKKIPGITFHRFPIDPETRNAWIMAVRRANWMPSRASMLCSEHFTEDVIDRCSMLKVCLHKGAVPTVFKGFPKELQEKLRKNPPPKFVLSKNKMLSKKTDPVPKDVNPPKYFNPASSNAPTKIYDMKKTDPVPPPKFVLSKNKILWKKTDPVPKDINPPKYFNPASNNAPTKIYDMKKTDPVPKDINPPKYLNPASRKAPAKTCDMSLEIQRQIDVKKLKNNLEGKMKLKRLLKREQRFIKRINSLNEIIEEQSIQLQNMQEFTAILKNEHYRRFKEIQDYKQAS